MEVDDTVMPEPAIAPEWLEALRCPVALHSPEFSADDGRLELVHNCWLVCAATGMKYPIVNGIVVMMVDEAAKWRRNAARFRKLDELAERLG